MTLEDCFATGGHFYNADTLEMTTQGMVIEHFCGNSTTNNAHPQAPIALVKLLDHVHSIIDPEREVREEVRNMIDPESIARLCVVIRHLKQINPEVPGDGVYDFNKPYWTNSAEFAVDFPHAQELVDKVVTILATEDFQKLVRSIETDFSALVKNLAARVRAPPARKIKVESLNAVIERALQEKVQG